MRYELTDAASGLMRQRTAKVLLHQLAEGRALGL
jgi:hypothetical protein